MFTDNCLRPDFCSFVILQTYNLLVQYAYDSSPLTPRSQHRINCAGVGSPTLGDLSQILHNRQAFYAAVLVCTKTAALGAVKTIESHNPDRCPPFLYQNQKSKVLPIPGPFVVRQCRIRAKLVQQTSRNPTTAVLKKCERAPGEAGGPLLPIYCISDCFPRPICAAYRNPRFSTAAAAAAAGGLVLKSPVTNVRQKPSSRGARVVLGARVVESAVEQPLTRSTDAHGLGLKRINMLTKEIVECD